MAKPKPKKEETRQEVSEGAVEATIAMRFNSDGAIVEYECGNEKCQESLGDPEDHDAKKGVFTIKAGEEVECGACGTINFNKGFTVSEL